MHKSTEVRLFITAFAVLALTLFALLRFDVIERIAYAVEKGRLQAVREALPPGDRIAELTRAAREVAQITAPAVVSIESDFRALAAAEGPTLDSILDGAAEPKHARQSPEETDEVVPDLPGSRSFRHGLGSGFIFDAENGYVLTNAHVVDGAERVSVRLADGRERTAEVLGVDRESDLAALRVEADRLHELPLTDSEPPQVGDEVLAIGNPFGLDGTVTKGIISAINRRNVLINDSVYDALIQTDAAITPGSSGGPLVNLSGEVVGISTAMATGTGRFDGVGFAIPIARVRAKVDDLVAGGPGSLGVWIGTAADEAWAQDARRLGWTEGYGALVTDIIPGSAAEAAGLRPDDIILSVGDVRAESMQQLAAYIGELSPGTRVDVNIWRDHQRVTIPVRIGRRYAPR